LLWDVQLLRVQRLIKTPVNCADGGRGVITVADNHFSPVSGRGSQAKVIGPPM
jgi:hypothetical protein